MANKNSKPKRNRKTDCNEDAFDAVSRPGSDKNFFLEPHKNERQSAISTPTASTRSTESRVMSHLRTDLHDPREIPTHGIDRRPRGDNVARAFEWYDRKQVDNDSLDSSQRRKKNSRN